jgi:hypothetical protein
MHIFVGAVLHVTVLAIIGYLLLWSASKADGLVALIGRLLGLWVFILAVVSLIAVGTMGMFGGKPFGVDMLHGHGPGWMHHWDRDGDGSPDQRVTPEPTATPTTPANPAPAKEP